MHLTLHVGLPKTASTFLQYRVFSKQDQLLYVHNNQSSPLEKTLKQIQRVPERGRAKVEKRLISLLPARRILVSDENISMNAREPWLGEGPTPRSFCSVAAGLADLLGSLRVIVGVRRQDEWLASRYAESTSHFPDFGQEDFERRASQICDGPVEGSLQWLEYGDMLRQLSACLGPENVLVLPMDVITHELKRTLFLLEDFLGVDGWVDAYEAGGIDTKPRNVLSTGNDTWQLRGREAELRLSDPIRGRLLARYRDGNRELSEATGFDLERYGWF